MVTRENFAFSIVSKESLNKANTYYEKPREIHTKKLVVNLMSWKWKGILPRLFVESKLSGNTCAIVSELNVRRKQHDK